jgi:hypothetical protein
MVPVDAEQLCLLLDPFDPPHNQSGCQIHADYHSHNAAYSAMRVIQRCTVMAATRCRIASSAPRPRASRGGR